MATQEQPIEAGNGTQFSYRPTNKVVAATSGSAVGAAISTVVSWVIGQYGPTGMTVEVNRALTCLIVAGITAAFAFAFGYFTRPSPHQKIVIDPHTKRARIAHARPNRQRTRVNLQAVAPSIR
jgi:hypothetical protein